ncbi:MAG: BrnT family toxin [Candidatus Binatota bacterium]
MEILPEFTGFIWDKGNRDKNWIKHDVSNAESEEVFFNLPLVVAPDKEHSDTEVRFYVLGKTHMGRLLFVVFTTRGDKIRVISARPMKPKERRQYHESEKTDS